jgi:two-component system OmpR family sensor kinase
MFHFFKSIRTKLTLWYAFILLTTLTGFGLIAYTYSREQLSDNLDRSLRNEVKWVATIIETKESKVQPSRKFGSMGKLSPPEQQQFQAEGNEMTDADDQIWNQIYEHALLNPKKTMIEVTRKGQILFRSFTVGEESLMVGDVPRDSIKITTVKNEQGDDLRIAATSNKSMSIYVAYPLAELTDALDNLFSIFLILIPIALAVSVGGGWFLAYTSLRPVDEITKTAREISAHNLEKRIPPRLVDDEISRLISTFNEMIERLGYSFSQIKQFSIDASHELRTPLTIMRGEVELALRSTKTEEEYRQVLVSNLEEILRLASIIDNLLTLSKADVNKTEVTLERVDMKSLIAELYEDSEIIAMKKEIRVSLAKNESAEIIGDNIRLRQLFLNLLDNAIKYTPERGAVVLSSMRENGFVKVSVKDTGIGIPVEVQGKIFDRFYRVDKGRSREMGGSGLGLSIVKWIAGLHHGRVEVDSSPGKGSTFTVYLPL